MVRSPALNMDQKTEIRSYIKGRIRLNIDSKQIFNELCGICGPQTISMRTDFRWVKAFKAGKFSVEDDTCPGRPKTSVTKAAVKIVVEQDARLSVKDIASCTGISEGSVQTILRKSVWTWERFALGGYLIWVHMLEPQRRADNKQWKRKGKEKCPCIAKRTISSKKMMYAIFFNSSRPVVQVPCRSSHTATGRFYKNSVLKKVKEFYNKKRPSKGWSGVHLLHDNVSSAKCEVVK